MVRDWPSYDIN